MLESNKTRPTNTRTTATWMRRLGLVLTAIGLGLGMYVVGSVVLGQPGGAAQGAAIVLYLETAFAAGLGCAGFSLLVAGAEPFDESGSPLLEHEHDRCAPIDCDPLP